MHTEKRKRVSRALKAILKKRKDKLIREMYTQAIVEIGKIEQCVGELLEDAQDDALAILTSTLSTTSDCVPITYKSVPTVRLNDVQRPCRHFPQRNPFSGL